MSAGRPPHALLLPEFEVGRRHDAPYRPIHSVIDCGPSRSGRQIPKPAKGRAIVFQNGRFPVSASAHIDGIAGSESPRLNFPLLPSGLYPRT